MESNFLPFFVGGLLIWCPRNGRRKEQVRKQASPEDSPVNVDLGDRPALFVSSSGKGWVSLEGRARTGVLGRQSFGSEAALSLAEPKEMFLNSTDTTCGKPSTAGTIWEMVTEEKIFGTKLRHCPQEIMDFLKGHCIIYFFKCLKSCNLDQQSVFWDLTDFTLP